MRVTTPIYETILYILLINFTPPTLYSLTLLYHLKSIKNPVSCANRKREAVRGAIRAQSKSTTIVLGLIYVYSIS